MIERLVTLCFKRRGIVALVFLLVALYGWYCWKQLPLEAYPDIDVTSQVVTQVNGLAAEESSSRSPSAGARDHGHAGHARDALAKHLRPVADHRGVQGRRGGLLVAPAPAGAHFGVSCRMARSLAWTR
jgi:hypothetical protein